MTSNGLLKITIKLVGLAILISSGIDAAQSLPIAISMSDELVAKDGYQLSVAIAYLMPVMIGILFWLAPSAVANTIIKDGGTTEKNSQLIEEIELIALRVLGLYFLYLAISDMLYNGLAYQHLNSLELDTYDYKLLIIVTACELIIALCLIVGAKGLQNLFKKVRYSGR